MTTVVIGIGNPDRGDDGVGAAVARLLAPRLPPEIRVSARACDLTSLLYDWAGADNAICIDASEPAGSPGRIRRLDLAHDSLPAELLPISSHGFGLAEMVVLARTLGQAPTSIIVYAIEGLCFDPGAALSPPVIASVVTAADLIASELRALS